MKVLGAILAGGQSRRFGSDKALALLAGKPLIEYAIEALAAQADAVIVCGRKWKDWVPDRPKPGLGPLGGVNAALHRAAERGFDAVLSCPCDVPILQDNLRESLQAIGRPAFISEMPVIGFWPVALAGQLDAHFAASEDRSMRAWARAVGAVAVSLGGPMPNVNTPADLAKLRRP